MKPRKYSQTEKTIQPWIDQHECIQIYLQRLNANKQRIGLYLYLYGEWANKTPEQLLTLKNSFENSDAEKLLDRFTIAKTIFPDSVKWLIINAVKAFYRCNYHQLQAAAGKYEYTTKKAQTPASKETCLKLFKACYTPRDQALIMASTCTAIAIETMAELKWSHFEENWQQQETPCLTLPSNILKGHGKGKYRGVQQVTFLTPEAKTVFIEYRVWYQKTFNHTWQQDDHIFLSIKRHIHHPMKKEVLSRIMYHITQRAGLKYGIHDGRIRLQTALENAGVSPNWTRKAKGRKVKAEESPYSKPAIEQLRAKYREALPDLEFLTIHETPKNPQQQFLEEFAKVLERHPEKFEKFEQFILKL
jgi:hypothetical protein